MYKNLIFHTVMFAMVSLVLLVFTRTTFAARTDGVFLPPPDAFPNVSGSIDYEGSPLLGVPLDEGEFESVPVEQAAPAGEAKQVEHVQATEFSIGWRLWVLFGAVLVLLGLGWIIHKKGIV